MIPPVTGESRELPAGRMVGPYRLVFRLGKGGMGEVWAAQKANRFGFEKLVALKVLLGAEPDSNAVKMFKDEARAAMILQHPAIVSTTDYGDDGDILYLVMDLVRGPSLTALLQRLALKQIPLSPALVAYIGERIASALDYAYARAELDGKVLKLIHRDISPHNVLVDASGSVRLMDFGVARTAVQEHFSRVGTVRGKPSYMSPEQIQGGELDARSDLFALGIVLYEAACVKRLFGRSNPVKSMEAVVTHRPEPLPQIIKGFPEPLWAAISKLLEKDPNKRFQTAGEVQRVLSDLSRSLPGSSSATRDLGQLIETSFDAGAFDIDSKVREALEQIREQGGLEDNIPAEPTAVRPAEDEEDEDVALPTAFSEAMRTNIVWPSASASDPLSPEAMQQLQEQLAMAQAQMMVTPTAAGTGEFGMAFSNASNAFPVPQQKKSIMPVVAIAGAAAAVVVTIGVIRFAGSDNHDSTQIAPKPSAGVAARSSAQPGATAPTAAPSENAPPAPEPAAPNPDETPKHTAPAPSTPTKQRSPQPAKTKAPAETAAEHAAPAQPTPPPPPSGPVDRNAVFQQIKLLAEINREASEALKMELIEAGKNPSPEKLADLMSRVRKAMQR